MTEQNAPYGVEKDKDGKNAAAARALKILALLPGNALTGISNKALSEHLGTNPANISRALATLEKEGFATRLDNGLWGPSTKLLALCVAFTTHTEKIKRQAEELVQAAYARANQYLPKEG